MDYLKKLEKIQKANQTSIDLTAILKRFYSSYKEAAMQNGFSEEELELILEHFLTYLENQLVRPYQFEPFHQAIRHPIDYYQFGLDFIRPLIVLNESKALNLTYADAIEKKLTQNENIILFANHQVEPDPQAISILLEKTHPKLSQEMIFVAGHRVVSDPLCIPFSMGRNLLCIYSKKHIQNPIEEMSEKLLHNKRTMNKMKELLSEGGKCIYVAPSGGRDRLNAKGAIELAKFDPQSIEMFALMARESGKKTSFYPLSLSTYHLLPPPHSVDKELGEVRHATCTPIHLCFGEEIDMENFPGSENLSKKEKRQARADYIWNIVLSNYQQFST
ncbi:MAG TPA: 1-acyl-sn-glycerol-3-phosphate acyltransferase [Parachlamydiaceae bacterium]|nr:1-acyl-sn-glycerol-3-phosphate acyltransferase [Parachlamydiaceae bacterium]